MKIARIHTGIAAPLPMSDINTDVIYPQRFLRKPDRATMGEYLFHGLRYDQNGAPDPDFVLNRRPYSSATILLAGHNFGSGSSREHAPWALKSFGISYLVSSTFADIFKANCINNAILPATVPDDVISRCLDVAADPASAEFTIDLVSRELRHDRLGTMAIQISDSDRERLLNGNDLIDAALGEIESIERHEAALTIASPWLDLRFQRSRRQSADDR